MPESQEYSIIRRGAAFDMNKHSRFFFSFVLFWCLAAQAALAQDNPLEADNSIISRFMSGSMVEPRKAPLIRPTGERQGFFEAVSESTYIVGPEDYFYIAYGGKGEYAVVNSEGSLVMDPMPPIRVAGLTLMKAKREIVRAVSQHYKGDKVSVTLSEAKLFQVSVTGEFNRPGIYTLVPGARLSDVLQAVKGFSYLASRHVVLTSSAGVVRPIDLSLYFKQGSLDQNPVLNQGDRIFAPAVELSGEIVFIRDSMTVQTMQLSPGENLEQLVHRFHKFENAAEWQFVRVYRGNEFREIVLRKNAAGYRPQSGDLFEIHAPKSTVYVGGTVMSPGVYRYDPRFTLADYVARAGITVNTTTDYDDVRIISPDQDPRKARGPGDFVLPGDHIWVPRSSEAKARDYIGLVSAVSSLAVAIATLFVLVGTQ
jgi:protein involved in polysaccharide export with SLBB domain